MLADVFEKLRNNSLKNYGLFLSHYLSAPALRSDPMLNITKVELEYILDPDIYTFFERWSFFYFYMIYSKPNNKYLKSYDPKQKSKHIIHLDTNNLYG